MKRIFSQVGWFRILSILSVSLLIATGFTATAVVAQEFQPTLIADLDSEVLEGQSKPGDFYYAEDLRLTFFAAWSPGDGRELWSYDGDVARRVADLCPGPCFSNPRVFASHDGKALFVADDGDFGREIWSTDGTPEGTVRLFDSCPGDCSGADFHPLGTVFQNQVVFPAKVAEERDGDVWKLWSSDGTREGTSSFTDLDCTVQPRFLQAGTETLYWSCNSKLFATRGEEVHEIFEDSVQAFGAVIDDQVLIRRFTSEDGAELWKSDGTPEGSSRFTNLGPGSESGLWDVFGVSGDYLYFSSASRALYRANAETIEEVASREINDLRTAEDRVYFTRSHFDNGIGRFVSELWTAQGPGTERLLLSGSTESYLERSGTAGGNLFFVDGVDLWFSDGTPEGTRTEADLSFIGVVGDSTTEVAFTATSPEKVVFTAFQSQERDQELWESDISREALKVFNLTGAAPASGDPNKMTPVGERLVFVQDFSGGVWSTDGNPGGLLPIEEGPQAPIDLFPYQVDGEERVLYSMISLHPGGLWSTDGTETELLVDQLFRLEGATRLTDGRFLLEAAGENFEDVGVELWTSDLTDSGTEFLFDVTPGGLTEPVWEPFDAEIEEIIALKDQQIFAGYRFNLQGSELWASDGSPDGTVELAGCEQRICPVPRDLTRVRQKFVVFSAFDEENGRELWRTDGTVRGTKLIKDLYPGGESGEPHDFARVRPGRVLFFARNESGGDSLWSTAGFPGGTKEIVDLSIDGRPSFVVESKQIGRRLYFVLVNESTGAELWRTNGTERGTRLIRELIPGPTSSAVQNLTVYGDLLLFTARDLEGGLELWASDGTSRGTVRWTDLAPGAASSNPEEITVVGDTIYFRADNGETGRELWMIKP